MRIKSISTIALLVLLISSCNSDKYLVDKNGFNQVPSENDNMEQLSKGFYYLDNWKIDNKLYTYNSKDSLLIKLDLKGNKIQGNDGCNTFFGTFTLDQGVMQIGPTGGTKMYCGDQSAKTEKAFRTFLEQEIKIQLKKGALILSTDKENLLFYPK